MLNSNTLKTGATLALKFIGFMSNGALAFSYGAKGLKKINETLTNENEEPNSQSLILNAVPDLVISQAFGTLAKISLTASSFFSVSSTALSLGIPLIVAAVKIIDKQVDKLIEVRIVQEDQIIEPFMEAIHEGNHPAITQIIISNPQMQDRLIRVYINSHPENNPYQQLQH